jgi:hypothetical protein
LHTFLQNSRELLTIADEFQPNPVFVQCVHFPLKHLDEQPHQGINLLRGTAPVFATESKKSQNFDTGFRTNLDDRSCRLDTGPMARESRTTMIRRPAPIAIHNNCHMPREALQRIVGVFNH